MVIDQKAQEISLALIKVSVYVRRKNFRERIESAAFNLLERVAERSIREAIIVLADIEALVRFGRLLYEIEPVNADIILESTQALNSAIRQINESELPDIDVAPDIKSILSKPTELENIEIKSIVPSNYKPIEKRQSLQDNPAIESGNGYDNPAIRQSAIYEKVKGFKGKSVQLKDITMLFPGVSERTLRYDLQRLCAEGRIERVGQGGPATFYRVRVF